MLNLLWQAYKLKLDAIQVTEQHLFSIPQNINYGQLQILPINI